MEKSKPLPDQWTYFTHLIDTTSSEIAYWISRLEGNIGTVETELRVRTRVYDLLNNYAGILTNPDGLADRMLRSTADPELKKTAQEIIARYGQNYQELSQKYRRTQSR